MKTDYDVIVVGAGSMGMATGYELSKQGLSTLVLDAFDPPHEKGSHSGETRLIRYAYGEGSEYVPLVLRAQKLFNELQEKTKEVIFQETGVLQFGASELDFVDEVYESGQTHNIEMDVFNEGPEMNKKWSGLSLPDNFMGVYESKAGVLYADNIITTYRRLAIENDAVIKVNEPVLELDSSQKKIKVKTVNENYTTDKLVVSAGAYNKTFFNQLGLDIPLYPARRTVSWFETDPNLYNMDNFPGFVAMSEEGNFYGFPDMDSSGLKIGYYSGPLAYEPEYINMDYGAFSEDENRVRGFLEKYMPGAAGVLKKGAVCMFTMTPNEDFIIDFHPNHENIVLAGGFSGHGFKFASVVGEILTDLLTKGESDFDLAPFSVDRPALHDKEIIRNYLDQY